MHRDPAVGDGSFMLSGSGRCSLPWLTIFLHGLNNLATLTQGIWLAGHS